MNSSSSSYRYVICGCSCLLIFLNVGLLSNVFSIYFPFIMEAHGFTNTQLSLLNTMRSITALGCMFISDIYYEKLNLKKGTALALGCAVFSYLIYSTTSAPAMYYIASAISGIAYGLGGVIPSSILIRRWFPTHASTALGLAASGTGVASILGPFVITRLYQTFGISRTFFLEALLMVFGAVILFLLIRNEPPTPDALPDSPGADSHCISSAHIHSHHTNTGDAAAGASVPFSEESGPKLTLTEQLRVTAGLLFIGVIGLTSFSGLSMLYTTTGHSIDTVSSILSFLGGMLIVGKCSFGIAADHFGSSRALTAYCILLAAGQLMCCFAPWAPRPLILAGIFVLGIGLAIPGVSITIFAADFSSPKTYPKILKNYQLTYTLGGLFSSAVPGMIADAVGSYVPAYVLIFFCSIGILLLLIPVHKKYAK